MPVDSVARLAAVADRIRIVAPATLLEIAAVSRRTPRRSREKRPRAAACPPAAPRRRTRVYHRYDIPTPQADDGLPERQCDGIGTETPPRPSVHAHQDLVVVFRARTQGSRGIRGVRFHGIGRTVLLHRQLNVPRVDEQLLEPGSMGGFFLEIVKKETSARCEGKRGKDDRGYRGSNAGAAHRLLFYHSGQTKSRYYHVPFSIPPSPSAPDR
jgi:hypothetical protein